MDHDHKFICYAKKKLTKRVGLLRFGDIVLSRIHLFLREDMHLKKQKGKNHAQSINCDLCCILLHTFDV